MPRLFSNSGVKTPARGQYYYFTAEDDPQANLEAKLDRMVRLVRILDFFTSHVESFGEGQIFSATTLAARCNGDTKGERFLQETAKGGTNNQERLDLILQGLVRQGYLSEYEKTRQEYRVLSAINYLFEFADRIEIQNDTNEREESDAKT
ncbi:MAG: condensin complex protein MksE [Limisphaerales bacterium]